MEVSVKYVKRAKWRRRKEKKFPRAAELFNISELVLILSLLIDSVYLLPPQKIWDIKYGKKRYENPLSFDLYV